jgi:hypothetical protein
MTVGVPLLLLPMQAKGVTGVPFVWFWPRGASGCVTITHDVESEAGLEFCRAKLTAGGAPAVSCEWKEMENPGGL